jgi:hypothetical protein
MEGRSVAAAAAPSGRKEVEVCKRHAAVFAVALRYCAAALGAAKGLPLDVKPECGRGDDGRGSEDASPLHATVGGMETEAKRGVVGHTCHFCA